MSDFPSLEQQALLVLGLRRLINFAPTPAPFLSSPAGLQPQPRELNTISIKYPKTGFCGIFRGRDNPIGDELFPSVTFKYLCELTNERAQSILIICQSSAPFDPKPGQILLGPALICSLSTEAHKTFHFPSFSPALVIIIGRLMELLLVRAGP